MNENDAVRKKERLEEFKALLQEEFDEYEEMPPGYIKSKTNWAAEEGFAVEQRPEARVVLYLTRELLTDVGIPYNTMFQRGIKAASEHIKSGSGLERILITSKGLQPFQE